MESADQDTRRRAAMELVKGLSKLYEQQVIRVRFSNLYSTLAAGYVSFMLVYLVFQAFTYQPLLVAVLA